MNKNVAGQKFVVFAFNRTTNVPLTGDAANITANLQIDFGTSTATNDVNPTELEDGYYAFDATQAETNGDALVVYPASSTADIQVIGVPGQIYTDPVSFADDVVQTADHTAAIANIPTNSEFNARSLLAADYFDPAADTVANVTTVATTTTNADMRGTDSAATSAKQDTMETTLNAIPTTAMRGTDNAATEAKQDIIDTNIDSILVDTATTIPGLIAALNNISAAQVNSECDTAISDAALATAAALATVDTVADAIKVVTDKFIFTIANQVDSNIQSINDVTITGNGSGTPFNV